MIARLVFTRIQPGLIHRSLEPTTTNDTRERSEMERTNEHKLANALMGIMLAEAAPDAYSRAEGNRAWDDALDALRGHIPDSAYHLVEETAREHRGG